MDNKYIQILLAIILFDIALTVGGINLGFLIEFNPLMAYLISQSMALFIFVKIFFQCSLVRVIQYGVSKRSCSSDTNSGNAYYVTAIVAYLLIFVSGFLLFVIT